MSCLTLFLSVCYLNEGLSLDSQFKWTLIPLPLSPSGSLWLSNDIPQLVIKPVYASQRQTWSPYITIYVFFKDTTSNYPIDRAVTPPKFVEALIRATSLVSALEESSCSEYVSSGQTTAVKAKGILMLWKAFANISVWHTSNVTVLLICW